jgi:hypothetical protein
VTAHKDGVILVSTQAMCDEGDVATGGGVTATQAPILGVIVSSMPVDDGEGTPIGWSGTVTGSLTVYAICMYTGNTD